VACSMSSLTDDVAAGLCCEMEQEEFEQLLQTVTDLMLEKPYEVQESFARAWESALPQQCRHLLQQIILREGK
jgi:hypothetical protein